METLKKAKQLAAYACIILVGSLLLAALSTLLDMQDAWWKRVIVDVTHILWGVALTWTWLWIIGYFKTPDINDINRRMMEMQERLNDTLARINQANEPPAEQRQVDIEL